MAKERFRIDVSGSKATITKSALVAAIRRANTYSFVSPVRDLDSTIQEVTEHLVFELYSDSHVRAIYRSHVYALDYTTIGAALVEDLALWLAGCSELYEKTASQDDF